MVKVGKCPYCHSDSLQVGYIYNGKDDLVWTPEGVRRGGWINHPKKNEVMLSKSLRIKENKLKVHRCVSCGVFLIFERELEK